MNILVSVNSKYFEPLRVLLSSLARTQSERCNVYFLNFSLSPLKIRELESFCSFLRLPLAVVEIPENIKESINKKAQELPPHLSCETYVRLFAPFLLSEVDRVLWLDADCLVRGDLKDFYDQDLGNKVISACDHCNWILPGIPGYSYWEYPRRKRKGEYFNAGVILFDLEKCRAMEAFKPDVMRGKIALSNIKNSPCQDQSILNDLLSPGLVAWGDPLLYNLFTNQNWEGGFVSGSWQYDLYEKAKILHFCCANKPWNLLDPYDPIVRGYWLKGYEEVLKIDQEVLKQSFKKD